MLQWASCNTSGASLLCPGRRSMWVSAGHMLRLDSGQQGGRHARVVYITRGVINFQWSSRTRFGLPHADWRFPPWALRPFWPFQFERLGKRDQGKGTREKGKGTREKGSGKRDQGKGKREKKRKAGSRVRSHTISFPCPLLDVGVCEWNKQM